MHKNHKNPILQVDNQPPKTRAFRENLRFYALVAMASLQLISSNSWSKVEYHSRQLLMKDSEQIAALVRGKIKKAEAAQAASSPPSNSSSGSSFGSSSGPSSGLDEAESVSTEAIEFLKDGLRIVLSRPDQDGARTALFGRLRSELIDLNSFNEVLSDLTDESLKALANSKTSLRHQATYIVLLDSLLAEAKPELGKSPELRTIVERIRDAKIQVSEKLKRHQRMNSMSHTTSPSMSAAKILEKISTSETSPKTATPKAKASSP